jgi:hypothetical protein
MKSRKNEALGRSPGKCVRLQGKKHLGQLILEGSTCPKAPSISMIARCDQRCDRSESEACPKADCYGAYGILLDAMGGFIEQILGGVPSAFGCAPRCGQSIFDGLLHSLLNAGCLNAHLRNLRSRSSRNLSSGPYRPLKQALSHD